MMEAVATRGGTCAFRDTARSVAVEVGDPATAGMRNVYGFDDSATLLLPNHSTEYVAPLFAGAHILNNRSHGRTQVDELTLQHRFRHFASNLHLVHTFSYAEQDHWPIDLRMAVVYHVRLMRSLPRFMQNLALMSSVDRETLSAPN